MSPKYSMCCSIFCRIGTAWSVKTISSRRSYTVNDHWLTPERETEAFKARHHVKTTPQTFIDDQRVKGYDDLRKRFGKPPPDPDATNYTPVVALFSMTALMAMAASLAVDGTPFTVRAAEWFIAFSMCALALLKLQNVETFSTMFLNYDLLARRWVRYTYIYPFAEGLAGILMIAGVLRWLSIPVALFIGTVGAVSVLSISKTANLNAPVSVAAATSRLVSPP